MAFRLSEDRKAITVKPRPQPLSAVFPTLEDRAVAEAKARISAVQERRQKISSLFSTAIKTELRKAGLE